MSHKKTVVVVEDEFLINEDMAMQCEDLGCKVVGRAYNDEEAINIIRASQPQYVLMDVRIPGKQDGVDVAKQINEVLPQTRIIFITGSNEPPTINRIYSDHPFCVLLKPINPADLKTALEAD